MGLCAAVASSLILLVFTSVPVLSNTMVLVGQPSTLYQGRMAAFTAVAPPPVTITITNITFTINGVSHRELSDLSIQPVVLGMRTALLIINNVPASLNGNSVDCTAELSTGVTASCASIITQVQGTLGKVGSLNSEYSAVDGTFNVSWTAPPAIVIPPATTPERFYCVEISNGTGTESISCNRTGDMNNETSVIISDIVCGVNYNVTVTPFNRVGAGEASSVSFPVAPEIMARREIPILLNSGNLVYTYPVSGLVCTCIATILDASVMGELQCEPNATAGQITVTTNNVTTNRDFTIRIVASNAMESPAIMDNETTTSDIYDLDATSSVASQLDFSLSFIQDTRAQGAFMSFLFRENNGQINFSNSFFFVMNRATAENTNQLAPLPMGTYAAQAYDLEANGEITIGQSADQEMITVIGPTDPGTPMLNNSLGATINCSSNLAADGSAVTVMCSYDSTIYSGYSVCIQNQMAMSPKCIPSTESGSMVIVNGTINGEHEVFVNPTWRSSPPNGMIPSPHRRTYILTNVAVTPISPTIVTGATDFSGPDTPMPSPSSTPESFPPPVANTGLPTEIIIAGGGSSEHIPVTIEGVIAAVVLTSLVITILIVIFYIWRKKRMSNNIKRDEVDMKENPCYTKKITLVPAKCSNQLYCEISPDNAISNNNRKTDVEYEMIQPISHGGISEVSLLHTYEEPSVITKRSEN